MYKLLIPFMLVGCELVTTTDKLVYEDRSPAYDVPIVISSDTFIGKTVTKKDGVFSFIAPPDIEVTLCVYPPSFDSREICYEGYVYTPLEDGGLITIGR